MTAPCPACADLRDQFAASTRALERVNATVEALRAENERLREALASIIDAGRDIQEMAPHFIDARDVKGLSNYGGNIANIARAALDTKGER